MDSQAQQDMQQSVSSTGAPTTPPPSQSCGLLFEHNPPLAVPRLMLHVSQQDESYSAHGSSFFTNPSSQQTDDAQGILISYNDGAGGIAQSMNPPPSNVESTLNLQTYASHGQLPAQGSGSPPEDIVEWRNKFFDIRSHHFALPKQQWDELWIWMDNIWTPRRLPYTKKDGVVHHEWRCRYHKKEPLPSSSTGKRKREIRKYYGCPARMTANTDPSTRTFTVSGHGTHNHSLADLDATKICNGVREWTAMHVKAGRQPKEIEALVNGGETTGGVASARKTLDTAGGKLLNEKTIRNIARRWRWPAAKFNMRQDDLFKGLHTQYNTFPLAIQGTAAFHRDVCDVATSASTVDDFRRLLDKRRAERLAELDREFDAAAAILAIDPSQSANQHWDHVLQLFKDRSYDALVRYLASYIKDENAPPAPIPPSATDLS